MKKVHFPKEDVQNKPLLLPKLDKIGQMQRLQPLPPVRRRAAGRFVLLFSDAKPGKYLVHHRLGGTLAGQLQDGGDRTVEAHRHGVGGQPAG